MVSATKSRFFPTILLLAMSIPAITQSKLVEPPAPLLPSTLGDFTKTTPAEVGDGLGALPTLPDAAVLKEDGIKRYEHSDYSSGSGKGTITAYQFIDNSGATAALSYNRRQGATPTKHIGDDALTTPEGIVFQSGVNLVVAKFTTPPAKTADLLNELIAHLPKVAGPAAQPPLLPTYLPEKGLITGTPRYALGPAAYTAMGGVLPANILAFDKAGESVTAEYQTRIHAKGILTILLYPTPTIAGDEGRAIEAYFKANPVSTGVATIRREGPMLMLATGGFTPTEAQALVDNIHLRNELTWNKEKPAEFHAEVTKTASLLTSILVFCGVGALAAILLGFFLGFGRAGIRVLMGKPAASEPEFLRIDLSGKPNASLQSGETPH
ncbi:DUF6599 family protein [Granulicella sibirica]|uniref:Uncharacterized protein n=1 Tax=Granulicella sibirica TaxID=2479048 RepID=A0A4Q0STI7_9BACT|nr:DUF6599 family protein [Granulicella sibirica]RXH54285.1 hypothetical protein GRAN_4581 [Granulicella sibirica]